MPDDRGDLLQGTLELLTLKTLSVEPMHGWGIAQRIGQMSRGTFVVNQGSLYPALQRMKRKGWIRSEWRRTENNRRARYYSLTSAGAKQLAVERKGWERSYQAVNRILGWEGGRHEAAFGARRARAGPALPRARGAGDGGRDALPSGDGDRASRARAGAVPG